MKRTCFHNNANQHERKIMQVLPKINRDMFFSPSLVSLFQMKKIFLLPLVLMLLLTACYDRDMVTMGEITPPVLSNTHANSTFGITQDNIDDVFAAFNWVAADFGFQHRNPDYVLRMDLASNNFQQSVSLGTTKLLNHSMLVSRINQSLLALGALPGETAAVQFKVIASISAELVAESNVVNINFVPLDVVLDFPKLYLAGDHNGWSFTDHLYSFKSNNIYEGYIWMDNGENWNGFKMSFVPDWVEEEVIGDPNESGTSGTLQVGNWGGNNIFATQGVGYYRIIANLDNLTYQLYTTEWAVTGDFNGWSFTPMQFDVQSKTWSITMDVTAGGFKFIANENWSLIYGDDDLDGVLDPGHDGNNIPISQAGNYTIVLDLHNVPYSYEVIKN